MKKLRLFLYTLFVCTGYLVRPSVAQEQDTDRLVQLVRQTPPDTSRVNILNNLGRSVFEIDPIEARSYADEAVSLANSLNYREGLIEAYNIIGSTYWVQGNLEKAYDSFKEVLATSQIHNDRLGLADAYNNLGLVTMNMEKYSESLDYYLKALKIYEEEEELDGISTTSDNVAIIYRGLGYYEKSEEYTRKALRLRERRNDLPGRARSYNNMANIFLDKRNYDEAIKWLKASLEINHKLQNFYYEALGLNNMGVIYRKKGDYQAALESYQKALKIRQKLNDRKGTANTLNNIAQLQILMGSYDEAEYSLEESLFTAEGNDLKALQAEAYLAKASLDSARNNYPRALMHFKKYHKLMGDVFDERAQQQIAEIQTRYEIEKKETENQKLRIANNLKQERIEKQILLQEQIKLEADRQLQKNLRLKTENRLKAEEIEKQKFREKKIVAEKEKKEAENLLLKTEKEIKETQLKAREATIQRQNAITWAIAIGLALVALLAFVLHRTNIQKKRANALLTEKNNKINKQKEEILVQRNAIEFQKDKIEEKNKAITSSINYARYIQNAMLPLDEKISKYLHEYFIFYRPRDIVSGDFYWFGEFSGKLIIAAVDCTGHGVPGAFMSMIGNNLLNSIVKPENVDHPEQILEELHNGIYQSLKQGETQNKDGMDIALVVIDQQAKVLRFAGAHHPLLIIQQQKMREIKGDRYEVGGNLNGKERSFTRHTFDLSQPKSTTFYIFSDGYRDQFGGERQRKLTMGRFRKLIWEIHEKPMAEQQLMMGQALQEWMGDEEQKQIDDILVIGVRI